MTGVDRTEQFALAVEAAVEEAMPGNTPRSGLLRAMARFQETSDGTRKGALGLLTTGTARQREIACHVLGFLRDRRAVQALINLLAHYSLRGLSLKPTNYAHPRVIEAAASALQYLRDPQCVPALLGLLEHPECSRRGMAANALGWKDNHAAVDGLLRLLADPDPGVRFHVAGSLGDIGDRRAVEGLVSHLQRSAGVQIIGSTDPSAEALRSWYRDPDHSELFEVAWALGALRDDRAVHVLTSVLDDPESDIPEWAAGALAEIGSVRARDALFERLATTDPTRQILVARCREEGHKFGVVTVRESDLVGTDPFPDTVSHVPPRERSIRSDWRGAPLSQGDC